MKKWMFFLIVTIAICSFAWAKGLNNEVETQIMSEAKIEAQTHGYTFEVTNRDEDITISVTVDSWPSEASWNLWNDTAGAYYYAANQTFSTSGENQTVTIFLTDGLYAVDCFDTYGDGGIAGTVTDASSAVLVTWGSGDYTDFGSFPFEVGAPAVEYTVTPPVIEENVEPGTNVDVTLTVTNTGTIAFDYTTSTSYPLSVEFDAQTPSGHICLLGAEPVGDTYWVTSGGATGSGDPNYFFNIDMEGNILGLYEQGTTSTWGMRDLCYDGTYLYTGDDNGFYQIDPADGSVTTLFTGQTFGVIRALAYIPAGSTINGTYYDYPVFWTKSFGGAIALFDIDGNQLGTFAATQSAYGAAYDPVNNCVWAFEGSTANTPATTFSQWDLATASFTGTTIAVPMLGGLTAQIVGGGFYVERDGVGYLGGVVQGTPLDMIFEMELDYWGQSWLSITNNEAGNIGVGASADITVNLDASAYRGDKLGLIEIAGVAGLSSLVTEVPVTMTLGGGGEVGTFHLHLVDTYGDGWNGGTISVLVNGEVVLDEVTVATGSEADFFFDVMTGDEVFCDYTAGSWSYENEYYVYNNIGQLVISSGTDGATPEDLSFIAEVMEALYGSISGTVTTADGRTPIEGATITADMYSATTGPDGTYSIADVLIGTYVVECMADGYFPQTIADVEVLEGQDTVVDFAMEVLHGDTIEDPIYVEFAGNYYFHSSTSAPYNDDYDTGGADAQPDVVYEFTIGFDTMVDVSLLGSSFDTKLGIYEAGVVPGTGNYLYYNDDYFGREINNTVAEKEKDRNRVAQSALFDMELVAGTYVAVVDGYGSYSQNYGPYQIEITFDPLTIYDVQFTEDPSGDSPYMGEVVTVSGIVTATNGEYKFYLQDGYGPWNGVYLYSYDLDPLPAIGDEIVVTAEVNEYYGLTELYNVESYAILSSGNPLPDPYLVGTGEVDESLEGVLCAVEVATCTAAPDTYGAWKVDDGTGELYVDDDFYAYAGAVGNIYNVSGPITYSFDFFRILPRNAGDIEDISEELTWPPLNLQYAIDQSDIHLSWTAPTQYGWNGYYPGPQYLSWAAPERTTLFDVTDFGFSYPMEISQISHGFYHHSAYPWGADTTFTFRIYDADGATLLYESDVITALPQWNTTYWTIDPPLTVTDNFYVGVAPNPTTGFPSSLGFAAEVSHGYSGSPGNWAEDLEWATLIYMEGEGTPMAGAAAKPVKISAPQIQKLVNAVPVDEEYVAPANRALLGYNVYRDGVMINAELITETSYIDLGLAAGTYDYYVTAVWHMGESGASNVVTVELLFGTLEGTVTEAGGRDPIEGALVNAGTYSATTNDAGYYIIPDMLVGTYEVSCSALGYENQSVTGVEILDGTTTTVDFELVQSGGDIFFFDDFESGAGNWTFEGTWGLTEEGSHSPTHSMTESPNALYAANLNIAATLATPWDLSGVLDATLNYWYRSDIETSFDYMYLEISTDGTDWLNLETYDEEDGAWQEEEIALGGFVGAGYETVWIRWRFESDGGYETVGMLIDDVMVTTSMEDFAPPFIVHAGPTFYQGTDEDYVFTANIVDVSGIAEANVVFTLDGTDETTLPYTDVVGNTYTFTIPAQPAGTQVDYAIEATDASVNSNTGVEDGFVYIAGYHFIYDNGVVDFYTVINENQGAAVKIINPAGFQLNLAYALIRNYTDQSGQDNNNFMFHIWDDDGGLPGADLITPFEVVPEATYSNTSPMTRIDLRSYAAELENIQGNFYIGFTVESGDPLGKVHCTITQPGNYENSYLWNGTTWSYWSGTDLHFRAVAELISSAVGTVEGFVTRSDTGDPLAGALVTVGTSSGLSGADGSYSIISDPGLQTVTCELDGYNGFTGEVEVLENDIVDYDIELSPAFWAPVNLHYTYNHPNVILQWDPPEPPVGEIVELIYDNDVNTGAYSYNGYTMCTQMSPDEACQILTLKIYTTIQAGANDFNAEVWGWGTDEPTETMLYQENVTAVDEDWVLVDVSGENLMVDGDFLVGFGSINGTTFMGYDANLNNGRSWDHSNSGGGWATWDEAYLIRAIVQYGDGRIAELSPSIEPFNFQPTAKVIASERISVETSSPELPQSRDLTGYRVYRDGTQIGQAVSTFYLDANVPGGSHTYYVTAMYQDPTGESGPSNEVVVVVSSSDDNIIPLVTELNGNYPNPFNPSTKINFSLKEDGPVVIQIFNIKGELVKTLVNEVMEASYYSITWHGNDNSDQKVASGIYFYKMTAGSYNSTKKMILMK